MRKQNIIIFVLLLLIALPVSTASQDQKSLLVTAKGDGILKMGQEEFKIYTVVVKLLESGDAEITLVSDITVFVSGTWSRTSESQINFHITGTATGGGIEAAGRMLLRNDGKSLDRLWLQGTSKTSKKNVEVNFEAK